MIESTPMYKLINFTSLNWLKCLLKIEVIKSFPVRKDNIFQSINILRKRERKRERERGGGGVKIHTWNIAVLFRLNRMD